MYKSHSRNNACGKQTLHPEPKRKEYVTVYKAYINQLLPLIFPEFEAFEREIGVNGGEHITSPLPFL